MIEQVSHRSIRAQIAAVAAEGVADFGHSAVAVVGQAAQQNRGAAGAVAFVGDFLKVGAFAAAGSSADGAVDIVLGKALGARFLDRKPQRGVIGWVRSALTRGDGNLARQACEKATAFGILPTLAVLNVGPL